MDVSGRLGPESESEIVILGDIYSVRFRLARLLRARFPSQKGHMVCDESPSQNQNATATLAGNPESDSEFLTREGPPWLSRHLFWDHDARSVDVRAH